MYYYYNPSILYALSFNLYMNCIKHQQLLRYRYSSTNNVYCRRCLIDNGIDASMLTPFIVVEIPSLNYTHAIEKIHKWTNIPFQEVQRSITNAVTASIQHDITIWNKFQEDSHNIFIHLNNLEEQCKCAMADDMNPYGISKRISSIKKDCDAYCKSFSLLVENTSSKLYQQTAKKLKEEFGSKLFHDSSNTDCQKRDRPQFDKEAWLESTYNKHFFNYYSTQDNTMFQIVDGILKIKDIAISNMRAQIYNIKKTKFHSIQINAVQFDDTSIEQIVTVLALHGGIQMVAFTNMAIPCDLLRYINEYIDDIGVVELSFSQCRFETVELCNVISADPINLRVVKIVECSSLLDNECIEICNALKLNTHLEVINLSMNNLTEVGIGELLSKRSIAMYSEALKQIILSKIKDATPLKYPQEIAKF